MRYKVSDLVYFDDEGWAILCGINDLSQDKTKPIYEYVFISINDKSRKFGVKKSEMAKAKQAQPCLCRYVLESDLSDVKRNDDVMIFHKGYLQYATFQRMTERNGIPLAVVYMHDDDDYEFIVNPALVWALYHRGVIGDVENNNESLFKCDRCKKPLKNHLMAK